MYDSSSDFLSFFYGLAGTAYVVFFVFALFIAILAFLTPLLIYFIHRSTKRTAIAIEKTINQNERLIDLLSNTTKNTKDFEFGTIQLYEEEAIKPKDFG